MIFGDIGLQANRFNFGYNYQTSPVYLSYILTSHDLDSPKLDQGFTACELGVGQCLSINLHALTVHGQWYGSDLKSKHVESARQMSAQTELKSSELVLCDEPLVEFLKRSDLPEFSYICLQEVWSWVSPEIQQALVDFIKCKLKIGGVLYISYKTDPGRTNFEPFFLLLSSFNTQVNAAIEDPQVRLSNLKNFLIEFVKTNIGYVKNVDGLKEQIEAILSSDDPECLEELLNPNFNVSNFKTIASTLDQAKLSFVDSVGLVNFIEKLSLDTA